MKRMISIGLWIVGGFLLLIALVCGGASLLSFLERVQHGPGLLFADVEFFAFIALIAGILGQPHYSLPKNYLPPETVGVVFSSRIYIIIKELETISLVVAFSPSFTLV